MVADLAVLVPGGTVDRAPTETVPGTARVRDGGVATVVETVATEVPVALFYNCASHAVMMATPADLEDFAVGFSLAEGIVAGIGEIGAVAASALPNGIKLAIQIPPERARALLSRRRSIAGRSGCGLCGISDIAEALRPLPSVPATAPVAASAIRAALAALPAGQVVNGETGAVHAAAFAARDGRVLWVREDVGRHNALDKLIGAVARAGRRPGEGFVLVTSRCSMEMVQKAATFGFPLLVAISAPTSLAIDLAKTCGLTLAAFARGSGFNLYAHPEGVALAA